MANIIKSLKRFYEKHFKPHCPNCGGVMDSVMIDMKWDKLVHQCRGCKEMWI